MKFFYNLQTTFKNGFYVDYYFKNIFFFVYKKLILSNMFYIVDKYMVEKFFFNIKKLSNWIAIITTSITKMSLVNILKIFFFIATQLIIILFL